MAVRAIYIVRADDFGAENLCQSTTTTTDCSVAIMGVILGEDQGTVPLDYPPRFRCLIPTLDPESETLAADIDAGVKAFLMACGVPFGEGAVDTVKRL